jgi:hypothetical protein
MKLVLFVLAAAVAIPAGATTPTGMGAMNYYVGTWSCTGAVGRTQEHATIAYTLADGVLTQTVIDPMQGKMKQPATEVYAISYDAKHSRYVLAGTATSGNWNVAYAKPWTGNTESWIDQASSGKLRRRQVVRVNANTWTFTLYPLPTSSTPNLKQERVQRYFGTCRRAS